MKGYMYEIQKVGVIDNDDMRQYAWEMQHAAEKYDGMIDPTQVTWSI